MPRTESSAHQSAKLDKPPLKAGKNCPFHSIVDRDTQVIFCRESHQKIGGNSTQTGQRNLAPLHFIEKGLRCQSRRDGWTSENTNSAVLWIKMFAAWKYIKGRDAEKSVYGLVKTQNILWGFVFFKDGQKVSHFVSPVTLWVH